MALRPRACWGALFCVLLALQGACARSLFGVAPTLDQHRIRMAPSPSKQQNAPCHVDMAFTGDAKFKRQPCDNVEVVAEAVEVIVAFATGIEPAQVIVDKVGCDREGIVMTVGIGGPLSNSTISMLVSGQPLPLMASTLAPFGLTFKGAKLAAE